MQRPSVIKGDWFEPEEKILSTQSLDIDRQQKFGQMRVLTDEGVQTRYEDLRVNPPSGKGNDLVRLTVWYDGGTSSSHPRAPPEREKRAQQRTAVEPISISVVFATPTPLPLQP